ncbi:MAG: hypothetical protein ABIO46_00720 [Chitinophagales bacterium]
MIRKFLFIILICIAACICRQSASAQNPMIQVSGWGIDSMSKRPIINLQLINKRTQQSSFSDNAGYFQFSALSSDSLFLVAIGYSSKTISFRDSVYREKYLVKIYMNKIQIELPNIDVQSSRDFDMIKRDALKLGYDKKDYELHGYQVLQSPITAIYQQFSNREKDKRGYAELMNKVRHRELQREVLQKYLDTGVIDLKAEDISSFLDFCNISEYMLKNAPEYEIALYMKSRYLQFIRQR